MKPGVPWSVKGIEPEAREAAKLAARRAGMTLGAWLNHMILESGEDAAAGSVPPGATPYPAPTIDLSPVTDAVRDLIHRLEASEQRTAGIVERFDQSIEQIAERLDHSEQAIETRTGQPADDASLKQQMQQLAERLDAVEKTPRDARSDYRDAIEKLEQAVSAVVAHLETTEQSTETKLEQFRSVLTDLSHRVTEIEEADTSQDVQAAVEASVAPLSERIDTLADRVEQSSEERPFPDVQAAVDAGLAPVAERLDALSDRLDAAERARSEEPDEDAAVEASLTDLADRLAAAEGSIESVANDLETVQTQAADAAVQAAADNADAGHRAIAMESVQKNLGDMNDRLDRADQRTTEAIKTIEASLTAFAARLEELGASAAAAPDDSASADALAALKSKLDEIGERLVQTDVRARTAAETAQKAADDIAARAATSEEQAQITEELHDTLEQIVQRIAGLENDAASGAAEDAPVVPPPPPPLDGEDTRRGSDGTADAVAADAESNEGDSPDAARPIETFEDAAYQADRPPVGAEMNRNIGAGVQRAVQGAGPREKILDRSPGRASAYEHDQQRKRSAIRIGVLVVLLALATAYLAFIWSSPVKLDVGPAPIADSPESLDGVGALSAVEERVFDRDAAGAAETETAAASPSVLPASEPDIALAEAEPEAPASDTLSSSSSDPLDLGALPAFETDAPAAPPPADVAALETPPVEAAPTTPVATRPIEPAKPSLRAAAQLGNPAAQYTLGLRYARGDGGSQDYRQAAEWLEKAAEQDLAVAQYRIGTFYEKGRGVQQDEATARGWYERAAEQGNVKAMHNLAVVHAEGKGTPQDFGKAATWFAKAAQHGLTDSQYNLAILNERGFGMNQDLAEAYKWFAIAAEGGDAVAASRRDEIANRLDAETLVQARLAARTWTSRQPDAVANGDVESLRTWASAAGGTDISESDVARVQALLTALGYEPGPADGQLGQRTRDAIRAFELSAGMTETGDIGPALIEKLEAFSR